MYGIAAAEYFCFNGINLFISNSLNPFLQSILKGFLLDFPAAVKDMAEAIVSARYNFQAISSVSWNHFPLCFRPTLLEKITIIDGALFHTLGWTLELVRNVCCS